MRERRDEVLVITGMSGAGRSTAGEVLEDLGWYVVDNLPPQMMSQLIDLVEQVEGDLGPLAVAVDVRGRAFFPALRQELATLQERGIRSRVLFLDASDETLVRRFESVRRPHPLQGQGTLVDGIARERAQLSELRSGADTVIDTSVLNVHQFTAAITAAYGDAAAPDVRITVLSFGFKYGLPLDADHVTDVRFLPNPYWVPELKPFTGRDEKVSGFVLGQPRAGEFVTSYLSALQPVLEGYRTENKRYVTLAVGCTGGKHRSVAVSEHLAARLADQGHSVTVVHRDLGRE